MSTHLDKGHLHNHIVVNSVSFMDGKMFRNDFKTYYQGIRKVSDDLCRQNQLSVIETDGRGISYGEWRNRREGKPTLRGMVKADVEMALAESSDFDDFVGKLQKMGYEVKYGPRVKHMAVRHQDSKRFVRLDGVAPQFSEAELRAFHATEKTSARNAAGISGRKPACAAKLAERTGTSGRAPRALPQQTEPSV